MLTLDDQFTLFLYLIPQMKMMALVVIAQPVSVEAVPR